MQNQQITSRTVSERTVLASIPGYLGPARDVEGLLNWTFHDQMAHSGGAQSGVFSGYDPMGYSVASFDPRWEGGRGLVPMRPKVHPLADAVFLHLLKTLAQATVDRLVVYAARATRPDRGDEPVWYEQPDERDIGPDGRPWAKYGYFGRMRWCPKRRRMVNNRHVAVCHIVRRGPSVEAQEKQRAAYRAWHAALFRAYESLKEAGFAVLPPAADPLPVEPWEAWTPCYSKPRDLVQYSRQ